MGCNKSLPVENPVSLRHQRTMIQRKLSLKKNTPGSLNTISIGSLNEHFKVLKALATTNTSTVLYAQDLKTGLFRAIREISKQALKESERFFREFEILSICDHPNIVKVYNTIETPKNFYSVFEYCDGGDLTAVIKKTGDEIKLSKITREVIMALNHLHLQGIVHCNMNPKSILISDLENPVTKLTGFDFSQVLGSIQDIDLRKLEFLYVSPEMLKKNFSELTDLWSVGVIVYEMLVGKVPFTSREKHNILKEIYNGQVDFTSANFSVLSFNAQDFLMKLLQPEPGQRMSAKQALQHPWLALSEKEYILNNEAMMKLRNFKVKTNITRRLLWYINSELSLKDHEIIAVFKNLDYDFDGYVSKDEIVEGFKIVGIDASSEIDVIMNNIDIDGSGALDFTEIKIALTNWDKVIKKKTLSKIIKNDNGIVEVQTLKHLCFEVLPHEWNEFSWKIKAENGQFHIGKLKEFLRSSIE